MTKQRAVSADYRFLFYIAILIIFGLMILTSASGPVGLERFGDSLFFIKRQILFGLLPGLVVFFVMVNVQTETLKRFAPFAFVCTIAALILPFIPGIGSDLSTGSNSWVVLGNYSFQPAEFAKLGLIIFMAYFLSEMGERLAEFKRGFLFALSVCFAPIILVILQPDIGTVAIMFAILFGILFFANAKLSHVSLLALAGIGLFALMIIIAPYRAARFTTFLHPELDPQGQGYQINQAFIAIGSGGTFGLGLGRSRQKFQYLPEVHADSIFAVAAEEMGFILIAGFILLITAITMRGLKIARRAPTPFAKLLVGGIIIWFVSQSFFNIGAMIGLLPVTGVPLPFVSHGGTAMMVLLGAVGIIAGVSRDINNTSSEV